MTFALPIIPPDRITGLVRGAPSAGGGIELPVFYPATGAQVSTLIEDDARAVDAAVAAARTAFDRGPWPGLGVPQRIEVLEACRETILTHAEELARLECAATGLILRELRERHIKRAAYNFRFFAEFISQSAGQSFDQTPGYMTTVSRVPVGVAALIAPWNAPVALATMKIAAALAFGNTCVLKPSEQTPLALARLVALLQDVLPEGVLNLVNGRGPVTGAALVAHEGVDRVSFTGGTETGRAIMSAAGRNLVPCTLELGGKSANMIFASADLDRAVDGALLGIFSNNGQQCLAGSRILVERSVFDEVLGRFTERAGRLRVGDPLAAETELGPLASAAHRDRVLSYVGIAQADGGRVVTGGTRRDDLGAGYFVAPTAVTVPTNAARVAQEEIFGPFATFLPFDSTDEAIAMANDTQFGLVSYVWSDHLPTVMRVSGAMRSGVVWVNTPMMRELRAPFGGFKTSGVGREGGASCEAFYTEERTVTIPTTPPPLRKLGLGGRAVTDYGAAGLLGVLVPQANTTVEPEVWALMPPGWSMLAARLTSGAGTIAERLVDYTAGLDATAAQFANAPVTALAFACTGASYLAGAAEEDAVVARVSAARGVPLVTAARASTAALRAMGARRVALLSPYPEDLTRASEAYWRAQGFDIVATAGPALRTGDFHPIYAMQGDAVLESYRSLSGAGADAVLMLGTGMATLHALAVGRDEGLMPAISCNLALVWAATGAGDLRPWLDGAHWRARLAALFPGDRA